MQLIIITNQQSGETVSIWESLRSIRFSFGLPWSTALQGNFIWWKNCCGWYFSTKMLLCRVLELIFRTEGFWEKFWISIVDFAGEPMIVSRELLTALRLQMLTSMTSWFGSPRLSSYQSIGLWVLFFCSSIWRDSARNIKFNRERMNQWN